MDVALAARKNDRESMASNDFHFDTNKSILLYLFQVPFQHQPKQRCTQKFIGMWNAIEKESFDINDAVVSTFSDDQQKGSTLLLRAHWLR